MVTKILKLMAVDNGYIATQARENGSQLQVDVVNVYDDPNEALEFVTAWLTENEIAKHPDVAAIVPGDGLQN